MPTVQLYGNPISTCTKRVLVTCKELGVDCKVNVVDFAKGEHKDPEYIKTKQPFGAIPVLVDEDGTQLYESRAICRYLTTKYGKDSGLLPSSTDLKAYGLFEQAASVEYCAFDPPAAGLTYERVFTPMMGGQPNEHIDKRLAGMLNAKLDVYDTILSKQKYLAGDNFTLADLFHLPYGGYINGFDEKFIDSRPNVKRWWEDISSRPSWKAIN